MPTFSKFIRSSRSFLNRGFTLSAGFSITELVVVFAIIGIITTTLVVQQSRWNDRLALNTQVYELALMLRQAQVYGLGVREASASVSDKFNTAYGVEINRTTPTSYIFFSDTNNDQKYQSAELLETKTLNRGVVIDRICGTVSSVETCSTSQPSLSRLSITFYRPDPRARLQFLDSANSSISSPVFTTPAVIYLRSAGGAEVPVRIESNGQISISIQ